MSTPASMGADTVRQIRRHVKGVSRVEQLAPPIHRDLERPVRDVRHLTVRMMMERANGSFIELHADHHEVRPVPENLPSQSRGDVGPRDVPAANEHLIRQSRVLH
jgi:hypothetical protein